MVYFEGFGWFLFNNQIRVFEIEIRSNAFGNCLIGIVSGIVITQRLFNGKSCSYFGYLNFVLEIVRLWQVTNYSEKKKFSIFNLKIFSKFQIPTEHWRQSFPPRDCGVSTLSKIIRFQNPTFWNYNSNYKRLTIVWAWWLVRSFSEKSYLLTKAARTLF